MAAATPTGSGSVFREIRFVLWFVLALNLLVAGAKLLIGALIHSVSLVADGFHSLTDASNNIVGLVGAAIAARPPDARHPYGHKKFETFTGICIGLALFMVALRVVESGIARLRQPQSPAESLSGFAVVLGTIVVNWLVTRYESAAGRRLGSQILLADAAHTRSDLYVSVSVLVSLGSARLGLHWVDPVVSLLIAVLIGRAAVQILVSTSRVLCDAAVIDPAVVRALVLGLPGVRDCHQIRTRGRPDDFSVDLHVLVAPDLDAARSHDLDHTIHDRVRAAFPGASQVFVHIEPYGGSPATAGREAGVTTAPAGRPPPDQEG